MSVAQSPVRRTDVHSRDPEFSHHLLRQSYLDFSVRLSGSTDGFEFSQSGTAAPDFSITRVRYSMDSELVVGPASGPVIVNTLRRGRLGYETGLESSPAPVGVPVLFPTGAGTCYDLSDYTADSVVLVPSALDRAASAAFGIGWDDVTFLSRTPVSPSAAEYWTRLLAHVESAVLADDEVAAAPLVMAEATRSLAMAVLVTFPNTGAQRTTDVTRDRRAEPAVLRRALAFVDEHAHEDIGVDDIAAAARIGVRGLQILFRRHRDRTPLDELRRVRMARAHADLRVADPTRGDTVAVIAARWGFSNPGRFAVQYRRIYGHSPADTLRS